MKKILSICKGIINVISILIILVLLCMSVFGTSQININENTDFNRDNWIVNIGIILVFTLICVWILKKNEKSKIRITNTTIILVTCIIAVLLIVFLANANLIPTADQENVITVADNFHHNDFTDMDPVNYLYIYPYQSGFINVLYYLHYIFGMNFLAYQILNVIALITSFITIYKICKLLFIKDEKYSESNYNLRTKLIYIGYLLFIPIHLYCSFIYGNILGFAFSLLAVYYEILYLKRKNMKMIIPSFIFILLAIIAKTNYAVTLIAMVILLILDIFESKRVINLVFVAIMVVIYFLSSILPKQNIERISGKELNKGIPMNTWVAMGLHEGTPESHKANGWYDSYPVNEYYMNFYDYEQTKEKAFEDIKENLKKFKYGQLSVFDFFGKKVASEWNEPTFQSIWIMQFMKLGVNEETITTNEKLEENTIKIYTKCFDIVQTLILFGALMYFICNFKKNTIYDLIFAIIFIGGFIFHLAWEAKSQYTITYFVLLIPYAVNGFIDYSKKILNLIDLMKKKIKA